MAASAKKKDKQAKPKPKGRPRSDAGERPADAAGVGELTMQQQVENIDKLVQQAVESWSLPTSLPITRLDESKARGSRTKALMEALRSSATPTPFEPESDLAAEKSEPRCLYGLAAAIAHGQQEGRVSERLVDSLAGWPFTKLIGPPPSVHHSSRCRSRRRFALAVM